MRSVEAAAPSIKMTASALSQRERREVASKKRTNAKGITTIRSVVSSSPWSVGPTTVTRPSVPNAGWMTVGDGATVAIGLRSIPLNS